MRTTIDLDIPEIGSSNEIILQWINFIKSLNLEKEYFKETYPHGWLLNRTQHRKKFLIFLFLIQQRMLKSMPKKFLLVDVTFLDQMNKHFLTTPDHVVLEVEEIENFEKGDSSRLLNLIKKGVYTLFPDEEYCRIWLQSSEFPYDMITI